MNDNIVQFPTRPKPEVDLEQLDDRELTRELMRGYAKDHERDHAARLAREGDAADAFVERVRGLGIARRVSDRQLRQLWKLATQD